MSSQPAMPTPYTEPSQGGDPVTLPRSASVMVSAIGAVAIGAALYPALTAHPGSAAWIYGALFLVASVWLVALGTSQRNRFALNAGFAAFGLEVLYLYFETLGTLLGTAAFFALGGVLLIAGSLLMARVRRRVVAAADEGKSS
jgi:hypothetical protein